MLYNEIRDRVRITTGPARQFPRTVSRCSPVVIASKRLQANQNPKRKCGVSKQRGVNVLLSPTKNRLQASSSWLPSRSGLGQNQRSKERPLNIRSQANAVRSPGQRYLLEPGSREAAQDRSPEWSEAEPWVPPPRSPSPERGAGNPASNTENVGTEPIRRCTRSESLRPAPAATKTNAS